MRKRMRPLYRNSRGCPVNRPLAHFAGLGKARRHSRWCRWWSFCLWAPSDSARPLAFGIATLLHMRRMHRLDKLSPGSRNGRGS